MKIYEKCHGIAIVTFSKLYDCIRPVTLMLTHSNNSSRGIFSLIGNYIYSRENSHTRYQSNEKFDIVQMGGVNEKEENLTLTR